MTTTEDSFMDDKGDSKDWAQLTEEETRKLEGLKKFYIIFKDKTDEEASMIAWADLQTECKRLNDFKWYK